MPNLVNTLSALNDQKNGTEELEKLLENIAVLENQANTDNPTARTVNDHLNHNYLLGGSKDDEFVLDADGAKAMRDAAFHHLLRLKVAKLDPDNDAHKPIIREYLALDRGNAVAFQVFVKDHGEALGLGEKIMGAAASERLLTPNDEMRNVLYITYAKQLRDQLIATSDAATAANLANSAFVGEDTLEENCKAFRAKLAPVLGQRLGYAADVVGINAHVDAMTGGDLTAMSAICASAVLRASQLLLAELAKNPTDAHSNPHPNTFTLLQDLIGANNNENTRTALRTALGYEDIKAKFGQPQADSLYESVHADWSSAINDNSRIQLRSQAFKIYSDNLFNYEPPRGLDTTNAYLLEALEKFKALVEARYEHNVAVDADDAAQRAAYVAAVKYVLSSTADNNVDNALTIDQKRVLLKLADNDDIDMQHLSDEDCLAFKKQCAQLQEGVEQRLAAAEHLSFASVFNILLPPAAVVELTEQAPLTRDSVQAYLRGGKADNEFVQREWTNGNGVDTKPDFEDRRANFAIPAIAQGHPKQELYNQLGSLLLRLETTVAHDRTGDMAEVFAADGDITAATQYANLQDCHQTAQYAANITAEIVRQLQAKIAELKAVDADQQQPTEIAKYQLALESMQSRQRSLECVADYYDMKRHLFGTRNGLPAGAAAAPARGLNPVETTALLKQKQAADLAYLEVQRISAADWKEHLSSVHIDGDQISVSLNSTKMVESKDAFLAIPTCVDTTVYNTPQVTEKDGVVAFELGLKDAKDKAKVEYKTTAERGTEVTVSGSSERVVQAFVALYQARLVSAGVLLKQGDKVIPNPDATAEQKRDARFSLTREEIALTDAGGQPLGADKQDAFYRALDSAFKKEFGTYYVDTPAAATTATPNLATAGKRQGWQEQPRAGATPIAPTGHPATFRQPGADAAQPAAAAVPAVPGGLTAN